ncbi:hypothetical protein [Flavobacterium sp. DG2-3]|uniref:hypothetical protein n=1 Tax=Flavobacterium sp. DG2-3 TaxID=3068317 RepID=UPI00273F9FF3|nr:hypothetical protein [Flavobacterium sp. DG2-3]MDP5199146.1 hypothetical protein [Flavobacterium sp. DG2-3]
MNITYRIKEVDGDVGFQHVTLQITPSVEGDYFDMKGNYLGSTKESKKMIFILGRDSLQNSYSSINLPENFYDKQVSFNGKGNVVNLRAAAKYGNVITDLSLQTRVNVAEKIYNHYYTEAGYDLSKLKCKTITDATNDPSNTGYAVTKLGGVSPNSEYLKENEADIRIVYGHIGLNFDTGYDIMSVCGHEHFHLMELLKLKKKIYDGYAEDRAYRYQVLIDRNWGFVSIGFKKKILENIQENVGDTNDKAFYLKARGDEKQYEKYEGWKPGKNITL